MLLLINCNYFPLGRNGIKLIATALIGIVCKMILPGPVIRVLKKPSPPNNLFLTHFML